MRTKKLLFVPFGGVAIAVTLAAAAYACTVFLGTLTVTGSTSGRVTSTGNRTGMTSSLSGTQAKSGKAGTFKVQTGAASNAAGNKLPYKDSSGNIKTYYLKFYNGDGPKTTTSPGAAYNGFNSNWLVDCMAGSPGPLMSQVTLNATGGIATLKPGASGATLAAGVVTQPLTKDYFGNALTNKLNTAAYESAVCISDPGGAYGNQAPLTIV